MSANPVLAAAPRTGHFAARLTMPRRRSETIARPRLDDALAQALGRRRVVLLCAAAGYGKTTALVNQLCQPVPGRALAWVNVAEDEDLPGLLGSLIAALDPLDLPWRQSPDEWPSRVLSEGGPALVVGALGQALEHAGVEQGVIVLDDVHRLNDPRAFELLNLLIRRLPPGWTLALTSRRQPPLALARLRVNDELAEFGEDQLRFGTPELRAALAHQGLDPDRAEPLYQTTRGWPVGVMTLRVALQLQPRGGAPQAVREWRRRLFDYLAHEVLADLDEELQRFLLRCSVLHELSAARCVEVSGDARALHWMAEIERRDLFVSVLDAEALTLRLHDLFREFLEARLLIEEPAQYTQLLLRAAAGEPDFIRRLGLLLRAGANAQALDELMERAVEIMLDGGEAQLLRMLDQFPPDLAEDAPELVFVRALCAWRRYEWQTMAQAMMQASAGFEQRGKPAAARRALAFAALALNYGGWLEEARQLCARLGDDEDDPAPDPACLLARYADAVLQGPAGACTPVLWRLLQVLQSSSELQWLSFLPLHGTGRWGHRRALQALAHALARAADDTHPRLKTTAMLLQAVLALWRGDVAACTALRGHLERESAWLGDAAKMQVALQYLEAIEKHVSGDPTGARGTLRAIFDAAQRNPQRRPSLYLQLEAAFAAAEGEWEAAATLANRVAGMEQPHPIQPCLQAVTEAELALHAGDAARAALLLEPLLERVADVDNYSTRTRLCVALARAQLRLGGPQEAWETLAPVLREARDSGEALPLLMVGLAALDELAATAWPAEDLELAVLHEVTALARELRSGTVAKEAEDTAALSQREHEVMQLIVLGRSNKLIARELGLSPHTVKRHVARILERTGQASRHAVADWYRRLN